MSTYQTWELLNEAVGGAYSLGLRTPGTIGGLVGSHSFKESPVDLADDDEDEDEEGDDDYDDEDEDFGNDEDEDEGDFGGDDDDYEEIDDDEDEEGEGDEEESDLFGKTPKGPDKGFPPDEAEGADGLPTPDEEMLGDEMPTDPGEKGMDDVLAGIDPELAGLGGDEGPAPGGAPAEPAVPGGEELEPGAGGEMSLDDELAMSDELGAMGDEEGAMGDEEGAADTPCPECNPDGESEEGDGDPDCEFCGGQGFVTPDQAEMPEDPNAVDAEMVDSEDNPGEEMMDLMARMQSYCAKYMPQYMPQFSRKYMRKDESCGCGKKCNKYMDKNGAPWMKKKDHKCGKHCKKQCCKENNEFLGSLADQARGDHNRRYSSIGTKPGQAGFAPQGRIGGVGGGYTKADVAQIPVLGESTNYKTWKSFKRDKK
jgi:hypothetical protein